MLIEKFYQSYFNFLQGTKHIFYIFNFITSKISKHGIISNDIQDELLNFEDLKSEKHSFIYDSDIEHLTNFNNATINYKVMYDDDQMKKSCGTLVSKMSDILFHPEIIVIIIVVSEQKENYITVTLCSDLKNTYLVFQRNKKIQNNSTTIYSHKACVSNISDSGDRWGNTGFLGKNILKVTNVCLNNRGKYF